MQASGFGFFAPEKSPEAGGASSELRDATAEEKEARDVEAAKANSDVVNVEQEKMQIDYAISLSRANP